jgi:hypothetical protein
MTNHFSFRRFLLLVKKQGIENLKFYGLCAGALAFILLFVFIFWRLTSGEVFYEEGAYMIYIFGLIIAGALFASFSFEMVSSKDKAIYYLSFPASRAEKLGVVLFYNIIVFPLAYSLVFLIIKTIFWQYLKTLVANYPDEYEIRYIDWNHLNGFMREFRYFFTVFFATQSFYILGSLYFNRFTFLKTTIVGSILIFLFVFYVSELLDDYQSGFDPRGSVTIYEQDGIRKVYELPAAISNTLKYMVQYIWAPVFLVTTYIRLKEKQV